MRNCWELQTAWVVTLFLTAGCAPYNGSLPSFPWQRQTPLSVDGQYGAGSAASANGATGLLRPNGQRRFAFLSELQRRANDQARLAAEQQQRLQELERLQGQQEERDRLLAAETRKKLNDALAEKQRKLTDRYGQLKDRASDLDANNRDLHAQIARAEQKSQVLEDQVQLLKKQLQDTTTQLAESRRSYQDTDRRLQTLQATTRRRSGASITANSSLTRGITAVMVPGMDIRQDGDLVRISLPSDKLFMPGTATLHQGATPYLDQVADVISRSYPRQIIGVEGHVDQNLNLTGTLWRNTHQLTAAQAMAIFEQLVQRHRLNSQQLFVLGHGSNHPLASGGTMQGQSINNRIEIVVYPEMFSPQ